MAVQRNNFLMHGTSGSFSRQITFKQYNGKTVVAHYPDMSKVIYSKAQLAERIRFKLAVAYARSVIADPVKKKIYAKKKHFSAYHAAIAEYINTSKAEEKQVKAPIEEKTTGGELSNNTITSPTAKGAVSGYSNAEYIEYPPS